MSLYSHPMSTSLILPTTEFSINVTWRHSTNDSSVSMSPDVSHPITAQETNDIKSVANPMIRLECNLREARGTL